MLRSLTSYSLKGIGIDIVYPLRPTRNVNQFILVTIASSIVRLIHCKIKKLAQLLKQYLWNYLEDTASFKQYILIEGQF